MSNWISIIFSLMTQYMYYGRPTWPFSPVQPASITPKSVIILSGELGSVLAITSPHLKPLFKSLVANFPASLSRLPAVKVYRESLLTQMKISRWGYLSAIYFTFLGIVAKLSEFDSPILDQRESVKSVLFYFLSSELCQGPVDTTDCALWLVAVNRPVAEVMVTNETKTFAYTHTILMDYFS